MMAFLSMRNLINPFYLCKRIMMGKVILKITVLLFQILIKLMMIMMELETLVKMTAMEIKFLTNLMPVHVTKKLKRLILEAFRPSVQEVHKNHQFGNFLMTERKFSKKRTVLQEWQLVVQNWLELNLKEQFMSLTTRMMIWLEQFLPIR